MFSGGKSQGSAKPTALGTLLQSSTYGSAIPSIYGMTQTPLLAIWAANIRQGASQKKLKQFISGKKGGQVSYYENIDFLIGHNPITCVNQVWNNGGLYPMTRVTVTMMPDAYGSNTFTIDDDDFFSLISVGMAQTYDVTFDDYGGTGSTTATGTFILPLWNELETGPDPTDSSAFRNYPYVYRWAPSYGNTFYIDAVPNGSIAGLLTITYYKTIAATSYESPMQKNRMHFENELGDGDEFSGFESQQIIYPMFAGAGSASIDLGSSGSLPSFQVEVKAKWGVYAEGDADFADIIEDIIKSGISQAAIDTASTGTAFTNLSHGLSCYNFPGPIQKKQYYTFENGFHQVTFNSPNTAGNILVCVVISSGSGGTSTVTDTAGNTWVVAGSQVIASFVGDISLTVLYVQGCVAAANNAVSFSADFYHSQAILLELAGVDTFDGFDLSVGLQPTASVTTTNQPGFPEYLLAFSYCYDQVTSEALTWPVTFPQLTGTLIPLLGQSRTVKNPGTYDLTIGNVAEGFAFMLAFKSTVAPTVPNTVFDFVDKASLALMKSQCRAYGLVGSLTMTSQQSASDWLKDLYVAGNTAPVYYGFYLYSIPYAEQSALGNGAIYNSPTAPGPVANLSDLNGDFITNGGKDVVTLQTVDRSDLDNVLQLQCFSRAANYNQVVVSLAQAASISLYGTRKADAVTNACIQNSSVALSILGVMLRKNQLGGDSYTFQMSSKWDWLTPMDLITITDTLAGLFNIPVRITSMKEQDGGGWDCEAEPFIYGMTSPTPLVALSPTPSGQNSPNQTAGNVNTPIIFEPPSRLTVGVQELWIAVSSPSTIYGGCQIIVSTDGGTSYQSAGQLTGSATTGVTTADWPAHADPDSANDLALDLSESFGTLDSYSVAEENNFAYPGYVAGGTTPIPYELMAYGVATPTGTNKYTLKATGSGNLLRRSVFACPTIGAGVDHTSGSRFLFLDPSSQGILKLVLPPQWVGVMLYFKVMSFNNQGSAIQSASDVTAVTFTPTGVASPSNTNTTAYSQVPADALTNPTSTTIVMAAVVETFLSNIAKYNARTFTISVPSVNTWYYVTIADPGYLGDVGTSMTRTAYCETTTGKIGLAGYVFIGAILAAPGGGGTIVIPGGYPTQQLFLVNGG
jgi:hypothetical protein